MIGTIFKWLAGFTVCLVLQATMMRVITIAGIMPDLLLLLLFFMGIKAGILPCIFTGFLIGLGQDVYAPSILGQNALATTVTGFFFGLFNERMMRTDPIIKLVILLVGFIIHDAIFVSVTMVKIDAGPGLMFAEIFTRSIPRAVYSIALASLVYVYAYFVKPSYRR